MSGIMKNQEAAGCIPLDSQAWRYNFKIQEGELAFHRALNRSRLRRIIAHIQGLMRGTNIITVTLDDYNTAEEEAMPIQSLNQALGRDGKLYPIPALKKSHRALWMRLWLEGEGIELPPIKIIKRDGVWVLANDSISLVALELARYHGAREISITRVAKVRETEKTTIPYGTCHKSTTDREAIAKAM